jgi:aspartyl-tRNA synthetase
MKQFERTLGCGAITQEWLGKTVQLLGWVNRRRDHGGLIFIDLRDRSGYMQIVFNADFSVQAHELAHSLRSEFVVAITGKVAQRAPGTINNQLATGQWELQAHELTILSSCHLVWKMQVLLMKSCV